jgi:hypothetical protein
MGKVEAHLDIIVENVCLAVPLRNFSRERSQYFV